VTTITVREAARARDRAARRPVPAERLLVDEADPGPGPDHRLLEAELDLACASGLVTLLSVPVRTAYVLADVLGLPDSAGAHVLGTTAATYRQRVSGHAGRCALTWTSGSATCLPVPRRPRRARRGRAGGAGRDRAPVDLSTPDFVLRLRALAPELLPGLPDAGRGPDAPAGPSGGARRSPDVTPPPLATSNHREAQEQQ
jgi:hypothetical protein